MKERLVNLDIIRIFACLCICIIHFNASVSGYDLTGKFVYESNSLIPNIWGEVYLGDIGTGLFFLLSGASLEYVYPNLNLSISSLKTFYLKRIKAIYPLYLLTFLGATLLLFHSFNPHYLYYLPFSLIGLDGFLATVGFHQAGMYYKVGEWFLGCIICIYAFHPFISYSFHRNPKMTALIIFVIYAAFIHHMNPAWFFFQFPYIILGMAWIRYWETAKSDYLWVFTGIAIIIRIAFSLYLAPWTKALVMNWIIFMFFTLIYEYCPIKNKYVLDKIKWYSFLTYPIFLVHHQIIYHICQHLDLAYWAYWKTLILFILYMLCTIITSLFVVYVYKRMGHSVRKYNLSK